MSNRRTQKEMPTHSQFMSIHPRVSLDDFMGWEDNGKGKKMPQCLWKITKSVGQGCRANLEKQRHGFTLYAWKPTVLGRLAFAMKNHEEKLLKALQPQKTRQSTYQPSNPQNRFASLCDEDEDEEENENNKNKVHRSKPKAFVKLGKDFQMGCAPSIAKRRKDSYNQRVEYRAKRDAKAEGKTYKPKAKTVTDTEPKQVVSPPKMDTNSFPEFGANTGQPVKRSGWTTPPSSIKDTPPVIPSKQVQRLTLQKPTRQKQVVEYDPECLTPEWTDTNTDNWDTNASKHVNEIRQDCMDDEWDSDEEQEFEQFMNEADEVVFC
jgi:hypothetical protein